jgi:hypothetical protein
MREPCMTLKELARLKGVTPQLLRKRAERVPFPPQVVFSTKFKPARAKCGHSHQYVRSELLSWFDNSLVRQQN